MTTPFIDPNVAHVGISKLRTLNAETLRNLKQTLVIQDGETPLAVIVPYEVYLAMQGECELAAIRRGDFTLTTFGESDVLR
jgi:hypothetical protein